MWAIFAAIGTYVALYYFTIGVCRAGFALAFLLRWSVFLGAVSLSLDVARTLAAVTHS